MPDDKTAAERIPTWLQGRVIGPWYLRAAVLTTVVSLSAVQKSGFAAGFIAASGALLFAATLALPSLPLRLVRLTSGGMAAVSGAALSLQFGFTVTIAEGKDDSGLSGALVFALAFAGVAAWTADLRLAARDLVDQRALRSLQAERHDELLARLEAAPKNRHPLRIREVALLLVALRLVRR